MKTVYVVLLGWDYEGTDLDSVWDTRAAADLRAAHHNLRRSADSVHVVECQMNGTGEPVQVAATTIKQRRF